MQFYKTHGKYVYWCYKVTKLRVSETLLLLFFFFEVFPVTLTDLDLVKDTADHVFDI